MKHPIFERIAELSSLSSGLSSSSEVVAAPEGCEKERLDALLPLVDELQSSLIRFYKSAPSVRFTHRDLYRDGQEWRFSAALASLRDFIEHHDEIPRSNNDLGRILPSVGVMPEGAEPDTESSCFYASFPSEEIAVEFVRRLNLFLDSIKPGVPLLETKVS